MGGCWAPASSSPCQLFLPHADRISKAGVCLLGSKQTTSRVGKYLLTQAQNHNIWGGGGSGGEGQRRSQLALGALSEP